MGQRYGPQRGGSLRGKIPRPRLNIDTEGYGGFFAHYGGHEISDVTFKNCTFNCERANLTKYPNGVLGGVIGEGGYVYMSQVCMDNCRFRSNFEQNGLLMGRCLTDGGANFLNCVLKDCSFMFKKHGYNGFLVGDCFGGRATDCALYGNEHDTMAGTFPCPFVGLSRDNEEFYVTRCYNTRDSYGSDDLTKNVSALLYHPAENVKYSQVVLNTLPRTVNYIDALNRRLYFTFTFLPRLLASTALLSSRSFSSMVGKAVK